MLRTFRTNPLVALAPAVLGAALGVLAAPAARARLSAVAVSQLGEQDFANNTGRVTDRQIRAAGAGEAYPFNGAVFGDDRKPGKKALGSVRYTHTFDPTATGYDIAPHLPFSRQHKELRRPLHPNQPFHRPHRLLGHGHGT